MAGEIRSGAVLGEGESNVDWVDDDAHAGGDGHNVGQRLADQARPATLPFGEHGEPVAVHCGDGVEPEGGDQGVVVHRRSSGVLAFLAGRRWWRRWCPSSECRPVSTIRSSTHFARVNT